MRIILMGNPNLGKSVVFNRLTGADVIASNYPGTTVEFTLGHIKVKEQIADIIDVPGTYTLEPACKAEEAVAALVIGFLRKDVALGMLAPIDMTWKKFVIAAVVPTMYFPCVATFATLVKELGVGDMVKSAGIMVISSLVVGGLLNLIL